MTDSPSWIVATDEAVTRASNSVRLQADLDAVSRFDDELDEALQDLTALVQAAALGRGDWWTGVDAVPELWNQLRAAQRDLDSRQVNSFVRLLTRLRAQARDAVQGGWSRHVASQAGDAVELRDLVKALAGVEEIADVAPKLDTALGQLTRLQGKPPNAEAVRLLNEVSKLLALLEHRLPPAVKTFVSSATRGGAALDLLDDDVRTWLFNHNALHNFRVVPGRPQDSHSG